MISTLIASSVTTLALSAAPPPAPWTTVPPMFYSEIVQKSDVIITGTVLERESRYENGRATIRTYVTLGQLSFHKGAAREALSLRFEGGEIGDDRLVIPGMPQLQVGKRYFLYVDGTAQAEKVSPIVGFHQGAFEVVQRNGRDLLVNMAGQELIGVQNDRFVFRALPQRHDEARPVAPQATSEDHTVKLADPNVEAVEARMIAESMRAAQRARIDRRLPELPGDGAPVTGIETQPPVNSGPEVKQERDRSLATPLVIKEEFDSGARMSVSDMATAARRWVR